ncbi:PREDICTED: low-density lipoprotein receptor class A domain-containing protein 4 [Chinchilla lanigera]|uniref:low-density lipoprotein receptor class A domain-containing protein 4 n=1 Tax=Chinchilla lanigera TaxID=34839 RepID=UPI000696E7D6|nr:PREDICTED: low-density lipoprotein receptor class A domain-containing protein 4 [Chinchilla lanigera]
MEERMEAATSLDLCAGDPRQSSKQAELEFAQIVVIVVVVTVMVVVIVCLLSHYRVSTRSFIQHPDPGRRRGEGVLPEGCLWPADGAVLRSGASEVAFVPRDRFGRPAPAPALSYARPELDLPPTIALADGEEPPHLGARALRLRDPEQQRELSRESVRAPPNRTVFAGAARPCPPSSRAGVSAACARAGGPHGARGGLRGAGPPPPPYSEAPGPPGRAAPGPQARGPASLPA